MKEMLVKIAEHKKLELRQKRDKRSLLSFKDEEYFAKPCQSLVNNLQRPEANGILAEFKHRSPSKPKINLGANLEEILDIYAASNVSAFSILTDEHFFGGQDAYITRARNRYTDVPILRKEFIIDRYQLYESKALGADVILLIAELLSKEKIEELSHEAQEIGLEILLEMHDQRHVDKLSPHISVIGVNNRDLETFVIDYNRSSKLLPLLDAQKPKIAESGLSDPDVLAALYKAGFRGFLIGEYFMKQAHLSTYLPDFIDRYMRKR